MAKVYAFLATGFEEVECLAVSDILIRGNVEVRFVSITDELQVMSSHNIPIQADYLFSDIDWQDADLLFLPGGVPGTPNLAAHQELGRMLKESYEAGKRIAAICAAPSVLGGLGILQGKLATCYPGYEAQLSGARISPLGVVTDGTITTARGLGYSLDLGLELLKLLTNEELSFKIKAAIQYE